MSLDELKGILAIGGIAAGVLLGFMLLLKSSRPLEQRPLGPGWTLAILAVGAAFLVWFLADQKAYAVLVPAALLGGIGVDAGRTLRSAGLRSTAMGLGGLLQLTAVGCWAFAIFGRSQNPWQIGALVLMLLFSGLSLLRQIAQPDWNAGWLTRTLSLLLLVSFLFSTQWLMGLVWAVMVGGPLLAASLDRKSKTSDSPPPALEPTA